MKKILLIAVLFINVKSYAQTTPAFKAMMYDFTVNFYTVCDSAEAYFKTIDRTKKGSGYKDFVRWRELNEYKYYPSGDRSLVDPFFAEKEFIKFKENYSKQYKLFPNGWEDLGPYSIDSITGHYAAGLGRIEDVYIDPSNVNKIYIGSRSGGFWKTINGGATWTGNSTDFLLASGVNTITASSTNADSILINVRNANNGMSHGIYRSINGGNTWTQTNFNPTNIGFGGLGSSFTINEIAYHPRVPNLIFIASSRGIYRSTDNLQTWTQLFGTQTINEIEFHPTDNSIIYLGSTSAANSILVSTDQGVSYVLSGTLASNNNSTNKKISTSPNCPNCVYVASDNGVWRSVNQGTSFTFLTNPPQACDAFVVSDLDTSNMICGYVDLEQSTDGGQTFNQVTYWSLGNTNGSGNGLQNSFYTSTDYIHADLRNARCLNGVYYVTTDGYLCKSTDNGVTWQRLSNDVGIRENYRLGVAQSNHERVAIGSQDNGMSIHTEKGWVEFYGADGMEAIIHPTNDDWMVTSLQYGGRRRTLTGGLTQEGANTNGNTSGDWIAPLAFDPNNQMHTYDFRDSVYKSTDFADNYVAIGKPTFSGVIKHAAIAENNSNIIVIARNTSIEKSTNGGVTFTSIKNNLPNFNITDIAFDPNNDDRIIVTYGDYNTNNSKVWITNNGGSNWTNITHNLGSMPIRSVVMDHTPNSTIYLGAEIGIYSKSLSDTVWSLYNTDFPNVAVLELDINYGSNTIKAATWGRGLWEYNLVGRKDFPAILSTKISTPPTLDKPKKGVDQIVKSVISYDNSLSAVYCEWSTNAPTFGNVISMTNTIDSTWATNTPLPDVPVGTKVYFKVFAVGDNNDTTETYKYMYEMMPFNYCAAMGDSAAGNLYIENVTIENINNISNNDLYTNYNSPYLTLFADSTYNLDVTANTGWSENDYGAWIDFNGDADFTTDENILWAIGPGSNTNSNFTVPSNAKAGDTVTMRVRLSYWGADPRPCGTQFGEVEDYQVILKTNGYALDIEPLSKGNIKVHPNPTEDFIHVTFMDNAVYKYELSNQMGQIMESGEMSNRENSINLSDKAAGLYFLKINEEVIKVLKKN